MTISDSRPHVFISYAHHDAEWLEQLLIHIKPYVRGDHLSIWSDKDILPGDNWRESIALALDKANAAILLVSPHFLASDFICQDELTPLLEARKNRGLRIFWLLISDCAYRIMPIASYQAAHDISSPLAGLGRVDVDRIFAKLCERINPDPN